MYCYSSNNSYNSHWKFIVYYYFDSNLHIDEVMDPIEGGPYLGGDTESSGSSSDDDIMQMLERERRNRRRSSRRSRGSSRRNRGRQQPQAAANAGAPAAANANARRSSNNSSNSSNNNNRRRPFGGFLNSDETAIRSGAHSSALIQIIQIGRGNGLQTFQRNNLLPFFEANTTAWFGNQGFLSSFREIQPAFLRRCFAKAKLVGLRIYDEDHSSAAGAVGETIPDWILALARLREDLNHLPTNGNAQNARIEQARVSRSLIGANPALGDSAVDADGNVIPQQLRNERSQNNGGEYAQQVIGGEAPLVRVPAPEFPPVQDRDDFRLVEEPARRSSGGGGARQGSNTGNGGASSGGGTSARSSNGGSGGASNARSSNGGSGGASSGSGGSARNGGASSGRGYTGVSRRNVQNPSNASQMESASHRNQINGALASLGDNLREMGQIWSNPVPQPVRNVEDIAEGYARVRRLRSESNDDAAARRFYEDCQAALQHEVAHTSNYHRSRNRNNGQEQENDGGNERRDDEGA